MAKRHGQRIALLGDSLLTHPISPYREARFLQIRRILGDADVVFTNIEGAVHRYLADPFEQSSRSGGTYVTIEPHLLQDLKWLGVNLAACGSSHADDYGPNGFLDTIKYLDETGIAHAGSGRHLAEAQAPGFLETATGRVALIAATSQYNHGARAGEQRHDTLGYPGVNGLRHKLVYNVDKPTLDELRRIGKELGWEAAKERIRFSGGTSVGSDSEATYNFLGKTFQLGASFGESTYVHPADLEANLRQVRHARAFADRVIVSLHCHEEGGDRLRTAKRRSDVDDLADFAIDFGRKCIDAGADIFVAHGPQMPMAIEVYKGKPLFHGIGTFVFQIETVRFLPSEAYERYGLDERATPADFVRVRYKDDTRGHTAERAQWEQLFAVCDFAGDALGEIRLYPIDLGFDRSRAQRGRPLLADSTTGARILKRVQRLSSKHGTKIESRKGIGVIRPAKS